MRASLLARLTVLLTAIVGLTVAVPVGQPRPESSRFPLAGVWELLTTRPAWALDDPPSGPKQQRGGPSDVSGLISGDKTSAHGGSGSKPGRGAGELAKYTRPQAPRPGVTTTDAASGVFDPLTSRRVDSGATKTSDLFRNADGTYTLRVSPQPVNYKAADGSWRPIDTKLVREADRWQPTAAGVGISLGSSGGDTDLAVVTLPAGQELGFGLDDAVAVQPAVSGSTATYRQVVRNTDLQLTAVGSGIKNTLILNSADAPNSWVFPLRFKDLRAVLAKDGSVELLDKSGKVAARIPHGYMQDSQFVQHEGDFVKSDAVTYELVTLPGGGQALKVTADRAWLDDPARVYPVQVDPTTLIGTDGDVHVDPDPGTGASQQNGDSIAVGWDGDRVGNPLQNDVKVSYLRFDEFGLAAGDHPALTGMRISWAQLNLFHTWASTCSTYKPVYVHPVMDAWSVAGLENSSTLPRIYPAIGEMLIQNNYPACTNTGGNRSVGQWVSVVLNDLTIFNAWSHDVLPNNGLALTAPSDNNLGFKRFTSENYAGQAYQPSLYLTYAPDTKPQLDDMFPENGYSSPVLQPSLVAKASDAQGDPLTYNFKVYNSAGTVVATSGVTSSPTWTVPVGALAWSQSYTWTVLVNDGPLYTEQKWHVLTTVPPQPLITSKLSRNGSQGFEPSVGNYTTSAIDADISTVGPALKIERSYNSRDPRTGAFGPGWSSILDSTLSYGPKDVNNNYVWLKVTYPDGQDVVFGRNADGSYSPPPGRTAVLRDHGAGVFTLTDKQGMKFTFNHTTLSPTKNTLLTSLEDPQGRALVLDYPVGQYLPTALKSMFYQYSGATRIAEWPGRMLTLVWSGDKVSTVSTERATPTDAATVSTWTYTYTSNRLTKVCPPDSATYCAKYEYGANGLYAPAVMAVAPHTYLRLNETAGTNAASQATNPDSGTGTYSNVELGQPGFPGSQSNAARFNGTASKVTLPNKSAYRGGTQTVALWFKASPSTSGVLYSKQSDPLPTAGASYNPVLYIGEDGKLRGEVWQGAMSPLVSTTAVADGKWHHAAIVAAGSTQTLYLDGTPMGTLSGTVSNPSADNFIIGAGQWNGWSGAPAGSTNGYFHGSISDFSFFTTALTAAQIRTLRDAGATSTNWLYPTAAHDAGPHSYLRLNDAGGQAAVGEVTDSTDSLSGSYVEVQLGQAGPTGSTATAAGFNGTSSRVVLSDKAALKSSYQSVAVWFKTSSAGGVLYSASTVALPNAAAAGWNPILYVGDDGKLYGELWMGAIAPMTSGGVVNDGQWHHAVLSVAGNQQTMYLDGVSVGSLNGSITSIGAANYYIGAGQCNLWHGCWGAGDQIRYFNGTISDFSFYTKALTAMEVQTLRNSGTAASAPMTRILRPLGGVKASVLYDQSGVVERVTDENGGTWNISSATVSGSDNVYAAAVLGGAPVDYWRLGDTGTPSTAKNEVNGNTATFSSVTLGQPGPFQLAIPRTAAKFNPPLSSYIQLPSSSAPGITPFSVSMWFKLDAGQSGVLYSYQEGAVTNPAGTTSWVPALYVGTDGKLHGKLWTGVGGEMLSAVVADGKWHHVALAASESYQAMYVDGTNVGSLSDLRQAVPSANVSIGAGKWAGWPATSGEVGYWPGHIAEVALYRSALTAGAVAAQFAAYEKSEGAPTRSIAVADPYGNATTHRYDASNGRRLIETIDPLGAKTISGYDSGGFLHSVTDPLGNMTTTGHDVRGNTVSQISCQDRSANICSTSYYTYYPDSTTTNLSPDPRNDQVLTVRGPGSTSASDNTYLTTIVLDTKGNRVEVVDPLGRRLRNVYTDGSGSVPAGLVKLSILATGAEATFAYNSFGDIIESKDAVGLKVEQTWDGHGRAITKKVTGTEALTTGYKYDKLGRLSEQTDPGVLNRVTGVTHTRVKSLTYDFDGNLTETKDVDLTGGDAMRKTTTTYDALGKPDKVTDLLGYAQYFDYDLMGRLVRQVGKDGVTTTQTFDAAGREYQNVLIGFTGDPNSPTAPQNVVLETKQYDASGRLAVVTDSMGYRNEYTYTDNGLITEVKRVDPPPTPSAEFIEQRNEYDSAGNLKVRTTGNLTTRVEYKSDPAGRTTEMLLDPSTLKRKTAYTYNVDDTLRTATQSDAGTASSTIDRIYDLGGRQISESIRGSGGASTGPSHWYKLDNVNGQSTLDSTVAGNAGTVYGPVNWVGGAASFNADSDIAVVGQGPMIDTESSFTVSVWAKVGDTNQGGTVIGQDADWRSGFEIYYNGGDNWGFVKPYGDGNWGGSWNGGATPTTTGTWVHLVGVYDGGAGVCRFYVNGNLTDSQMAIAGFASPGPLTIGRGKYGGAPASPWKGQIDNVQVYPRAVSGTEAASLFGKGRDGSSLSNEVTTSWTYDKHGNAITETDPNGNVTEFGYDQFMRHNQTKLPSITVEEYGTAPTNPWPISWVGYNNAGEVTGVKDAKGRVVTYVRDAVGREIETRLPLDNGMQPKYLTGYDPVGRILSTTDARGKTTSMVYDQLGRVAKATARNGGISKYTYDLLGRTLSLTDPEGARSEATYDYLGRTVTHSTLVRQPSANTYTTNYSYYTGGSLYRVTSPSNTITEFGYNALKEVTWDKSPAGNYTDYTYDFLGRRSGTFPTINASEKVEYDVAGYPVALRLYAASGTRAVHGPEIDSTTLSYDKTGNLLSQTDFRGHSTTFTYDAIGQLKSQVEPVSSVAADDITSTFGYDVTGMPTRFTDGRSNAFWTTYNNWGMVSSRVEPATAAHPNVADRTFTTTYDIGGRAATQTSPGGVTATYTFDDMDQLTRVVGAGAEMATADRTFSYDLAGRIKTLSGSGGANTLSYDDRSLLLSATGPSGNSSFTYNSDGQMATRVDAAGTTSYGYSLGRLSAITNTTNGIQQALAYNQVDQLDSVTYGGTGDVRRFTYDARHRLSTDELKTAGGTSVAKVAYGWDDNGNETSKTITGFGASAANVYTYDRANRLASWTVGSTTTNYAYDKSGNRTQAGAKTFTYNERNQLLASPSAGTTYSYTPRGTLSRATTGSVSLDTKSNAFGQVIRQYHTATAYSEYSYDGLGRAIKAGFSYTGPGNDLAADGTATYTRDPAGSLVGVKQGATGVNAWTDLHQDVVGQFGNTASTLSGTAVYDPLGKVLSKTGMLGNLGYQSEWTESSTSRVNMHARWYNPDTGQFDSRDSWTISPTPESGDANRYSYVNQNPLTNVDPSGHHRPIDEIGSYEDELTQYWIWKLHEKEETGNPAIDCGDAFPCFLEGLFSPFNISEMLIPVLELGWSLARLMNDPVFRAEFGTQLDASWEALKKEEAGWEAKLANLGVSSSIDRFILGWGCVLTGVCERINDCFGSGEGSCWYHVGATIGDVIANYLSGGVAKLVDRVTSLMKKFTHKDGSDGGDGTGDGSGGGDGAPTRPDNPNNHPPEERPEPGPENKPEPENKPDPGKDNDNDGNGDDDPQSAPMVCPIPTPHSFDPATPVLMADGSAKPIGDITIGEKVVATDPVTGQTTAQEVTALHANLDEDLTNVTIGEGEGDRSTRGPTAVTLETTDNHPFWDAATSTWVDAADLDPGKSTVVGPDGKTQTVLAVDSFTGSEIMRDLTVANVHTYYVVAGDTTTLVHNNNGSECGARELLERAKELRLFKNTTAVVKVRSKNASADGTFAEEIWISSSRSSAPASWKDGTGLRPGERYIAPSRGRGDKTHAEEDIMDALGDQWEIIEGASNVNICKGRCLPGLQGLVNVGGETFRTTKPDLYSPWRLFWKG